MTGAILYNPSLTIYVTDGYDLEVLRKEINQELCVSLTIEKGTDKRNEFVPR